MIQQSIPEEELSNIVAFLSTVDLFKKLNRASLKDLAASMTLISIGGGEMLIRQGELDTSSYILLQGRLRVYIQTNQPEDSKEPLPLAEISVGEIVGEIALLTNQPRTGSVRAIRDSLLLKLDKRTFSEFEKHHPHGVIEIAKTALKRLLAKSRPTESGENTITIAVAPAGDSNHRPFIHYFVQELNKIKPTLLVNPELCNRHFEKEVAQTQLEDTPKDLIAWLQSLENQYTYVVYETDRVLTFWTHRCLRQADRILLVADSSLDPALNSIEKTIFSNKFELQPYVELICLHSEKTTVIKGTDRWLKKRQVSMHHHLKLNTENCFDRYIRFLTGRAFAVVLNGGGARGFAHIGVIKSLEQLNQPIDYIAGCSMGAVIGGCYAMGAGVQKILDFSSDYVQHHKPDYTLPLVSLLTGKSTTDFFQNMYGDIRIEDLWVPFFCTSANITQSKLHIHNQGPLWLAIRASISIPGIYPPIYDDQGNMLVDGGIINNMPVDLMRKLICGGKILAVNCSINIRKYPKIPKEQLPSYLSGWKLFFKKYNPFIKDKKKFDSIFEILLSSLTVFSEDLQKQMEKEADYLLQFDTSQFGTLEFQARDKIIDLGYRITMEKLPDLLKGNNR